MRMEFLSYDRLIDCTKIHAALIPQHRIDVIAIKNACQQSNIIQIQLQQVLAPPTQSMEMQDC